MTAARRRGDSIALLAGAAALVLVAAGVVVAAPDASHPAATSRGPATSAGSVAQDDSPLVVRNDGAVDDALYPYDSAEAWVTYADHVVVVTVTGEQALDPPGSKSVGREVTLRVDRTLWAAAHPRRPAPELLTWNWWGWAGGNAKRPTRVAVEHRSRLEVGHTYVLPLRWEHRCSEDDGHEVSRWVPLAGKSIYPDDGGTIGTGELEGRYVRAEEFAGRDEASGPNYVLRRDMNGRTAADLVATLRATSPRVDRSDPFGAFCKGAG